MLLYKHNIQPCADFPLWLVHCSNSTSLLSLRKQVFLRSCHSLVTVNQHLQGLLTSFSTEKVYLTQHGHKGYITNRVKSHSKLHKYCVYAAFFNIFLSFFIKCIFFYPSAFAFMYLCSCWWYVSQYLNCSCCDYIAPFFFDQKIFSFIQSHGTHPDKTSRPLIFFELSMFPTDTKVVWEYENQNSSLRILFLFYRLLVFSFFSIY